MHTAYIKRPCDAVLEQWRLKLVNHQTDRRKMADHFCISVATTFRWLPGVLNPGAGGPRRGRKATTTTPVPVLVASGRRERELAKRARLLAELQEFRTS